MQDNIINAVFLVTIQKNGRRENLAVLIDREAADIAAAKIRATGDETVTVEAVPVATHADVAVKQVGEKIVADGQDVDRHFLALIQAERARRLGIEEPTVAMVPQERAPRTTRRTATPEERAAKAAEASRRAILAARRAIRKAARQ